MRLWWATISAAGRPRLSVVVSEDHLAMAVIAGDVAGLPGPVERWLRQLVVALRSRADGPSRWGPSDLRALHAKIQGARAGVTAPSAPSIIDMTEPEPTTCSLQLAKAILERQLSQGAESEQELTAA